MAERFGDLVVAVEKRLSMQSGASVQVYAEDAIAEMLQHKFEVMFLDHFWPDYTQTTVTTLLEGGVPAFDATSAEIGLARFIDIQYIYYKDRDIPIPKLSQNHNPIALHQQGSAPRYREGIADASKVFRLLPFGNVGDTIAVRYRKMPTLPFGPDDMVDMDRQALILGATYDYLEDDGTNPDATAKFLGLFEQRIMALKSAEAEGAIDLAPGRYAGTGEWQVVS